MSLIALIACVVLLVVISLGVSYWKNKSVGGLTFALVLAIFLVVFAFDGIAIEGRKASDWSTGLNQPSTSAVAAYPDPVEGTDVKWVAPNQIQFLKPAPHGAWFVRYALDGCYRGHSAQTKHHAVLVSETESDWAPPT